MLDEIELSSDARYSDAHYFADGSISNWNGRKILSETPAHEGLTPSTIYTAKQIAQDAVSIDTNYKTLKSFPAKPRNWVVVPRPTQFITPINKPQHVPNTAGAMIGSDADQADPVITEVGSTWVEAIAAWFAAAAWGRR